MSDNVMATRSVDFISIKKTTAPDDLPQNFYELKEIPEDAFVIGGAGGSTTVNEVMVACKTSSSANPIVELYGGSLGGPLQKICKLAFSKSVSYKTEENGSEYWCDAVDVSEIANVGKSGVMIRTDGVLGTAAFDVIGLQFLVAYITAGGTNTTVMLRYI